ncbi:putative molybdenum carrier protein [Pseudonocardia abyssalis]|uniref:putative molybdenum carrier protein n=1 Tax=Pseudonocardia abyssalis TaxID=2792008 RepID=UPI001C4A4D9F|nr:putative molybdenum carrier protein [Pseudonocardia abyssalis]
MERNVAITGTRSIGDAPVDELAEAFEAYLRPFSDDGAHFYVGGASGVDTAALQWLAANSQAALTVVVPCRLVDQPAGSTEVIDRLREAGRLADVVEMGATLLGKAAYHARDRWMVDRAGLVIGFPRGAESAGGGTWYTLNYAAEQGKVRLVVPL